MKKYILMITLLLSTTVYSRDSNDFTLGLKIEPLSKNTNPDGSVTIIRPKLLRGNASIPFGASVDLDGLCIAMGYEQHLQYSNESEKAKYATKAYLHNNGTFWKLRRREIDESIISKISCINLPYSSVFYIPTAIDNLDGSVTFQMPKLSRGEKLYAFGASVNLTALCFALGFDEELKYSQKSQKDKYAPKAYLYVDGSFWKFRTREIDYSILSEITCYNYNEHSVLIQDLAGKIYIKK